MAERYCAENLVFRAGQRTLIDDVSLTLSQGELVALIGPNGAGKSTLLRLLTGYLKPTGGRCSLAGTPLAVWQPHRLSRYRAVMRQNTQLGFDWPVEAVVGMGRAPWTRTPEASVIEEVMARDLLEVQPLTHIRGRSLHDAFVIVDEAQSLERGVLLTVLSRIGQNSKVVLTHDVAQRDNLRVGRHDGIAAVIDALRGHDLFAHVTLTRPERSAIAALVTDLLERDQTR